MRETIDMIIGTTIGALVLFYVFAFPILRFKRRYFYDTAADKNYAELLTTDFYDFILKKTNLNITKGQLFELVSLEHKNFKSKPLTLIGSEVGFAYNLAANLGSKRSLAKKLASELPFVSKEEALRIVRLEEKYLRRFYPWWQRLI